MSDPYTTASTGPSTEMPADPCINLCVKDSEDDVCLGCGRTQNEIKNWAILSSSQQASILCQTNQRLDALTAKRRKRRNARHLAKAP